MEKKTFILVAGFFLLFQKASYAEYHKENVDILVLNAKVVTMDNEKRIVDPCAIAIKNDTIVRVGETDFIRKEYKGKRVIDAKGNLILPGLINTHTHAAMTFLRGYADDLALQEWLEKHIWPVEAKYVDPDTVYWGTLLACAEMIRAGVTTFNDMYFFEDKVAEAANKAGVRAVIGEGLLDFPTPNSKTPQEGLEYTKHLVEKWKGHPLIRVAVAPHSPYTCSAQLLKEAKTLADTYQISFHIHLSETEKEVKDMIAKEGMTPVQFLDKLGVLDDRTIAAHCVHLSGEDMQILTEKKVGVAHDPESNMKLSSGAAPIHALLKAGAFKIGLATDGTASNNDLDMFEAMDVTAKLHKLVTHDPTVLPAPAVLEMATIRGAKLLSWADQIGSIEEGKKADIILIDLNKAHLIPCYNIYSLIVYSMNSSDVEMVIINGKIVMEKNKILSFNEGEALKKMEALAERIKKDRN